MFGTFYSWKNWPVFSLAAFLMISAFHFGRGDYEWVHTLDRITARRTRQQSDPCPFRALAKACFAALEVFVRGGFQFVAFHYYTGEVIVIFSQIIGYASGVEGGSYEHKLAVEDRLVYLMRALDLCYLLHQTFFVVVVAKYTNDLLRFRCSTSTVASYDRRNTNSVWAFTFPEPLSVLLELIVLQTAFTYLSPLLAFALYFNMFHSLRHVLSVWALVFENAQVHQHWRRDSNSKTNTRDIRPQHVDAVDRMKALRSFLAVALLFSIGALAIGYFGLQFSGFTSSNDSGSGSRSVGYFAHACFVAISALTTPHFILVEIMWLRSKFTE